LLKLENIDLNSAMAKIQGLENYTPVEIQQIVLFHINYLREHFYLEDLDLSIQGIIPFGSRVFGFTDRMSDLDIKIQYTRNAREDDLFNALNNLFIKGFQGVFSAFGGAEKNNLLLI